MSAVKVHVSYAYKNMDMTKECISLIFELMAIFLSLQITFSLVTTSVVWAILDSTSGLDPSFNTIAHRQTDRQTDRQADRQTDRQTDRQADRGRERDRKGQRHREINRRIDG